VRSTCCGPTDCLVREASFRAWVRSSSLRRVPGSFSNPGYEAFRTAKTVYADEGLNGSDEKHVIDQVSATVVGAHINSAYEIVKQGHVNVASPPEKSWRLARFCSSLQSWHTQQEITCGRACFSFLLQKSCHGYFG
jgi:hypothetical protein